MKVKIKDYTEKLHSLQITYGMVGVHVNYPTLDLLDRAVKERDKLGGDVFSIADACRLRKEHEEYWEDYFEKLDKEKKTDGTS